MAIHFNINHDSFNKRFAPGGTGLPRRPLVSSQYRILNYERYREVS